MIVNRLNPRLLTAMGVLAALLAAAAMAVVATPQAAAQQPAICDQYPNLPQCEDDVDDEGDEGDRDEVDEVAAGGGPSAGAFGGGDGGELPFTGYPLNALILLLLALLTLGLATRAYVAVRERLRDPSADTYR